MALYSAKNLDWDESTTNLEVASFFCYYHLGNLGIMKPNPWNQTHETSFLPFILAFMFIGVWRGGLIDLNWISYLASNGILCHYGNFCNDTSYE